MNDLIARVVCTSQQEDCFMGEWDNCSMENLIDILTHNNAMDYDDECGWTIWKTVSSKFDLQQITGSVASLLTEIQERWNVFLSHVYFNRQQREHIKELRAKSTDKTYIVAQVDFSMNYTLIRQREVQQGFFTQNQATLFTIHLTIGQAQRNVAIISNYMEHTTSFV